MPLPADKVSTLLTIKAHEEAKGRSRQARGPALFRETALDTHATAPPEYFGPRVVPEKKEYSTRISSGHTRSMTKQQRAAAEALSKTARLAADGEVRSVFQPTPEQMPVCMAAGQRRNNIANSEYALLDTLEVALYLDERDARRRVQRQVAERQREALDGQVVSMATARLAAEAAKTAEREEVAAAVAAHQAAERQAAERQRAANVRLKNEREAMLSEARAQRHAALAAKRSEEERLVAAAQAQLDADRAAASAKMAALRDQAARTRADNEARLAARKAAEVAMKQEDAETSRRMIEAAEAAARARDSEVEAFYSAIAARANRVGQQALDDRRARVEREERLMREAAAEAERRERDRVAADAERRARQKAELISVNEDLKRNKAAREAAARAEEARARAEAEARIAAEAAAADRAMAGLRDRTLATRRVVEQQMADTSSRALVDDVFMSEEERKINRRLLEQARATVGQPRQFAVRLY